MAAIARKADQPLHWRLGEFGVVRTTSQGLNYFRLVRNVLFVSVQTNTEGFLNRVGIFTNQSLMFPNRSQIRFEVDYYPAFWDDVNSRGMQAQINQSRTDTAISSHQAVYNSDYIPALIVKVEKGEGLTNEELLRYTAYFRAFNRDMDNQLWQYNQGLLGENIPRSIKGAVRNFIAGNSQGLEQWDGQKYSFTDEYVSFVEEAIVDLR